MFRTITQRVPFDLVRLRGSGVNERIHTVLVCWFAFSQDEFEKILEESIISADTPGIGLTIALENFADGRQFLFPSD